MLIYDTLAPEAEITPKISPKSPRGSQIEVLKGHLFAFIQFQSHPSVQTIQASEPDSKIILAHQFGWLTDKAMSAMLMVGPTTNPTVKRGGIDPYHGDEIVE
jgi:hypothetical protein